MEELVSMRLIFLQAPHLLMIKDPIKILREIVAGSLWIVRRKLLDICQRETFILILQFDLPSSYCNFSSLSRFILVIYRSWVRNLRPSITSGYPLMKPLLEKERMEGRMHRASSITGWNFSANVSMSASSPSCRYSRHAVPQIFAYEPKPGVFRNLNYPAFQSIRIEQVSICFYLNIFLFWFKIWGS